MGITSADIAAAKEAAEHINTNAVVEKDTASKWDEIANDNELPEGFRKKLTGLASQLRQLHIELTGKSKKLNQVVDGLRTLDKDLNTLGNQVRTCVEEERKIGKEARDLIAKFVHDIPSDTATSIEADVDNLEEDNPPLLSATQEIKKRLIAGTVPRRRFRNAILAALALGVTSEVSSCVQDETDQSPIEWVANWVFSSPADSQ